MTVRLYGIPDPENLKVGFGAGIQLNAFCFSASSLFFFLSICLFFLLSSACAFSS
jgi:hypothetical protein